MNDSMLSLFALRFCRNAHATFPRLSACVHPGGVIMIVAGKPAGSANSIVFELARWVMTGVGESHRQHS